MFCMIQLLGCKIVNHKRLRYDILDIAYSHSVFKYLYTGKDSKIKAQGSVVDQ